MATLTKQKQKSSRISSKKREEKSKYKAIYEVSWMGHSTFFIKIDNKVILTDPVWSKRTSPVWGIGPKRKHQVPISLYDIEQVDLILISHNHYDHLDKKTVKFLHQKFPNATFIVPIGLKKWFNRKKINNVVELDWWQSCQFDALKIEAVPAKHTAFRSPLDFKQSKCVGFVIKDQNKSCYFAGDTGFKSAIFEAIEKKFNGFDLSLIPIGAYFPRIFFKYMHICPKEAVKVHQLVRSKKSIGCHWNTFKLTFEKRFSPVKDLKKALEQNDLTTDDFCVVEIGKSTSW